MCWACWEEHGSHAIDTPEVRAAVASIARVYRFNSVGGNLHCELDDWNVDTGVESMLRSIDENMHGAPAEQLDAERECVRLWGGLSHELRVSALALYDNFWQPPGHTLKSWQDELDRMGD